jgi:hypothetical protein
MVMNALLAGAEVRREDLYLLLELTSFQQKENEGVRKRGWVFTLSVSFFGLDRRGEASYA